MVPMPVYDAVRLYKSLPDGAGAGICVTVIASSGASGARPAPQTHSVRLPLRPPLSQSFLSRHIFLGTCAEYLLQNKYKICT